MKKKKINIRIYAFSGIIVCLFAIILAVLSVYKLNEMDATASMIYEHPYKVSNVAHQMNARMLDMRSLIVTILTDPSQDDESIDSFLERRYAIQENLLKVIDERFLGDPEAVKAVRESFENLKRAQKQAQIYAKDHSLEEIEEYVVSEMYPIYDAFSNSLMKITQDTDERVQLLEDKSKNTSFTASIAVMIMTFLLVIIFIYLFMSEQKNLEEIHYREKLFDVLTRNIDDVFFIYNTEEKRLEYTSANIERILGLKADNLENELYLLEERFPAEKWNTIQEKVKNCNLREHYSEDIQVITANQEVKWMKIQIYPEIHNDKVFWYVASLTDQSEDRKIRQTLHDALINAQNANTAKQNFLSHMSHEIRTPMNAIIGMATIAAAYIDNRARVEDCLAKIGYSSKHLMSLINDVLDMSKIDEGKMTITKEKFDLEKIIESITAMFYPQALEKDITFRVSLVDIENTILLGDALRLNQVLMNLLSNAIKYTNKGGNVLLEISMLQKKQNRIQLQFCVKDTGVGMDKNFLNRIFLPFEQENTPETHKNTGTGLGMSITKNLVTLMGGTIVVNSEKNKGSVFTVELDFEVVEEAQLPHKEQMLASLHVLVADDDKDTCLHTALLLKKLGIESEWVLTGHECIEKVLAAQRNDNAFDVCFIDWKIPDKDGIEITRSIRQHVGPDTLIIIITAYDWTEIEADARLAGANAFLSKPIFSSALYNTLVNVTNKQGIVLQRKTIEQAQQMAKLQECNILLVEDNELNQEIAQEILTMAGMKVECACNGQEAITMFCANSEHYDAILMDIQMPIMDGYEATRAIRASEQDHRIPIIAMTADAFHEDIVKAMQAGMDGHISKPVDPARLYQMLKEKLKKS